MFDSCFFVSPMCVYCFLVVFPFAFFGLSSGSFSIIYRKQMLFFFVFCVLLSLETPVMTVCTCAE